MYQDVSGLVQNQTEAKTYQEPLSRVVDREGKKCQKGGEGAKEELCH